MYRYNSGNFTLYKLTLLSRCMLALLLYTSYIIAKKLLFSVHNFSLIMLFYLQTYIISKFS